MPLLKYSFNINSKWMIMHNRYYVYIVSLCTIFLVSGCSQPREKRQYQEITLAPETERPRFHQDSRPSFGSMPQDDIHANLMPQDDIHANLNRQVTDPQMQAQLNASVASLPLTWTTPPQWIEQKGSGMRLVTFKSKDSQHAIETTIVSLGGKAGGLEANITRWMRQIKLTGLSDRQREEFIASLKQLNIHPGLSASLVDFTELQSQMPDDAPSMMASIIETKNAQVFIKMTGAKKAIIQHKKPFQNLVGSIKINE